jgi:hypothetical protein
MVRIRFRKLSVSLKLFFLELIKSKLPLLMNII